MFKCKTVMTMWQYEDHRMEARVGPVGLCRYSPRDAMTVPRAARLPRMCLLATSEM